MATRPRAYLSPASTPTCRSALESRGKAPSFWRGILYRLADAVGRFGWRLLPQPLREL